MIDILFPDRDVSLWNTNDGSLWQNFYGNTSVMLTGTAHQLQKNNFGKFQTQSKNQPYERYLKVGHHGSRTSSSNDFVKLSPRNTR